MPEPRAVAPHVAPPVLVEPSAIADTIEEFELDPLLETSTALWAVVFAGGIGTRLGIDDFALAKFKTHIGKQRPTIE